MASGKQFDDLPNEVLLKIFTYLNIEELVVSTQNVCMRWREVSRDNKLWKNAVFNPRKEITDKEVAKYLESMPALRSYSATRRTGNIVIDALCKSCRNIRSIDLHYSHNMNIPLIQKIIQHFPHIESLRVPLPYHMLLEELIKFAELIGQCQSLRSLSLDGNAMCNVVMEGVLIPIADGCPSLQHIHLGYHGHLHEDILNLLQRKRYQLLSFSCEMSVTKNMAEHISACTSLQHLEIANYNDHLLYDDIQSLIKLKNLKYFAFRCCSEDVVNNLPMFFLSGSLSQIVHLDLSESYYISDITVTAIFDSCPQLQHLNISGSQSLQNEGLRYIGKCSHLQYLDLSMCMDLTDSSMEYVGAGCCNLKKLDISGCYKMTDKAIEHVVKCKELQVLKFNYNDLTGSSFHLISTHLQRLSELHLENCKYLNEVYVDELHKEMMHLKIIVARRCKEAYLDPEEAVLLLD
jgi:F-box/leucine-rich repeat protein 2/20